jgi:proteasome lid subunit RPN8/RPN11
MTDEVLKGVKPEDIEREIREPESKFKHIFIIVVGIFILMIVFSWTFSHELGGYINSKKVVNNAIDFDAAKIIFEGSVLQRIVNEYQNNEHREIKACLFGTKNGGDYIIGAVSFPDIVRANVLHVVSVGCPAGTIVDLHSHPINECWPSEQDLSTYEALRKENPQIRMMIMCGRDRFALF